MSEQLEIGMDVSEDKLDSSQVSIADNFVISESLPSSLCIKRTFDMLCNSKY